MYFDRAVIHTPSNKCEKMKLFQDPAIWYQNTPIDLAIGRDLKRSLDDFDQAP